MEVESSKLLHTDPRSPYVWQYSDGDTWMKFSPSINVALEESFCQLNNVTFKYDGSVREI